MLHGGEVMRFKIIILMIGLILLSSCTKDMTTTDTSNESIENLQTQVEDMDKTIRELLKKNSDLESKISELEKEQSRALALLNNYSAFARAIKGMLMVIPVTETNGEYEFETTPSLYNPAIRINIAVNDLPKRYKFYQSIDGKIVYLVYERDNVIWLVQTYVLKSLNEIASSDDIVHERKEYGIISRSSLSMDLLLEEDIQYHTHNGDFLEKFKLSLVFHQGSIIDGKITY